MLRSTSARSLDRVSEEAEEEGDMHDQPSTPHRTTSNSYSHARQHSKIHARNLSEFFPRPGHSPGVGYGTIYEDPHKPQSAHPPITDISSFSTPPRDATSPMAPGGGREGTTFPRAQNRRGHHHRHSVSHNLFPFLDPNSPSTTNSSDSNPFSQTHSSPTPKSPSYTASSKTGYGQLSNLDGSSSSSFRNRFGWLPLMFQLPLYSFLRSRGFPAPQVALSIAFTQITLGATLWIQGQSGESLSVTALGYLVVFDGLGTASKVVLKQGGGLEQWRIEMGRSGPTSGRESDLQQPFGLVRLSTLSHFSQAIYLLFSTVYVCKESIEHVLLLHGPHESGAEGGHGSGHGGVGHGEGRTGGGNAHSAGGIEPIHFPLTVLLLSAMLAIISAVFFGTHSELSQAVQSSPSESPRSSSSSKSGSLGSTRRRIPLFNPFTLTVAGFGIGLFGAALVLPPAQLSPLDKILSLLVSLSMFYIAYPAAQATGKILLQTAPAKESREAMRIQQSFKDIESHPLVLSIETPHVWQLVPPPTSSCTSGSKASETPMTITTTTVVTLTVIVKSDVDEKGMFEVTRWVEERCKSAGNVSPSSNGFQQREVTVQVKRAK